MAKISVFSYLLFRTLTVRFIIIAYIVIIHNKSDFEIIGLYNFNIPFRSFLLLDNP